MDGRGRTRRRLPPGRAGYALLADLVEPAWQRWIRERRSARAGSAHRRAARRAGRPGRRRGCRPDRPAARHPAAAPALLAGHPAEDAAEHVADARPPARPGRPAAEPLREVGHHDRREDRQQLAASGPGSSTRRRSCRAAGRPGPRWSPKTCPTIWSPSLLVDVVEVHPALDEVVVVLADGGGERRPRRPGRRCWPGSPRAARAAPAGWPAPRCRSSTPSRAARSASGMRDRMSSTAVMTSDASATCPAGRACGRRWSACRRDCSTGAAGARSGTSWSCPV